MLLISISIYLNIACSNNNLVSFTKQKLDLRMLALQSSRLSHSLRPYIRHASSKDTIRREFLLLKNLLADDLEKGLPKLPLCEAKQRRIESIFPLINELMREALCHKSLDVVEEVQYCHIKNALDKSICETMNHIMERPFGSKKGVMYESEYHKIFHSEMSLSEYFLNRTNTYKYGLNPMFIFGDQSNHFLVKENVLPSDAILYFLDGPTRADCGTTTEVVFLKAMLDLFGKNKFNAIFSNPNENLKIRSWVCHDPESSLHHFIKFVDPRLYSETCPQKLKLGDHVIVTGAPNYLSKRPFGINQNLHGIVVGYRDNDPLIGALGLKSSKTINEISEELLDDYNSPQSDEEKEYLNRCGSKSPRLWYTMEEMRSLKGGKILNENSCRISSTVISNLLKVDCSQDISGLLSSGIVYNWLDQLRDLADQINE